MKKARIFFLFLGAAAIFLLIFLPHKDKAESKKPQLRKPSTIHLKLSSDEKASTPLGQALEKFAQDVHRQSKGEIFVEVFHKKEKTIDIKSYEKLQSSDLDIYVTSAEKIAFKHKKLSLFNFPYLFANKKEYLSFLDGPKAGELLAEISTKNLLAAAFFGGGFRHYAAKKPLKTPADFENLRVRTSKNKVSMEFHTALNGIPIPIEKRQIKKAIIDGVVDAVEASLLSIFSQNLMAKRSHLTLSGHSYDVKVFLINQKKFSSMKEPFKKLIFSLARKWGILQKKMVAEKEEEVLKSLASSKITITHLTKAQSQKFTDALRPLLSSLLDPFSKKWRKIFLAENPSALKKDILIGLDTDLVGPSSQSGRSIQRGASIAISEINASGGLLGRKLALKPMNNSGIAARGIKNIRMLSDDENVVAVMGGIHSPVALAEIPIIHEKKMIYLDPWAAATNIVRNKKEPNYVFRVSVRDEFAGPYLVNHAKQRGFLKLGLLLENTPWGRGNEASIKKALKKEGREPVAVKWFNWTEESLKAKIHSLIEAKAEAIIVVSNSPEGVVAARDMSERKVKVPLIFHWGITGGTFFQDAGSYLSKIDLSVLQTHSFFTSKRKKSLEFIKKYFKRYNASHIGEIFSPVGSAHAYDLVHLLALAIKKAATIERPKVRQALENISFYEGLVKDYKPPFSKKRHDALTAKDFSMARYHPETGYIMPLGYKLDEDQN